MSLQLRLRLACTNDIAEAFYALAVHLRHVTGQVFAVDGSQEINRWEPLTTK
jgi:hypothetical protein